MKKILNAVLVLSMIFSLFPKISEAQTNTAKVEVIDGLDIYDEKNTKLIDDYFCGNTIYASATVKNNGNCERSVMLVIAYYDDALVNITIERQLNLNSEEEKYISADLTVSDEPQKNSEIKVFLWDVTDDKVLPVCKMRRLICGIQKDIYVSQQYGDDKNDGTSEYPLASLTAAQKKVRAMNDSMGSDINVHIEEGTYILDDTWKFTEEDSGRNGYKVNYIADGNAVISGGEKITNWEKVSDDVYTAEYNGKSLVREMYVDGVKMQLSAADTPIKPIGFYTRDENIIKKKSELTSGDKIAGVAVSGSEYSEYKNKKDIQVCYARGWKVYISTVTDIVKINEGSAFIMGDEFETMINRPNYPVNSDSCFIIKNAKELLDKSGEFYYDSSEKKIYCKAETAPTNVFVPVLEQLVNVEGKDLGHQAENITFSGIRFAHCAWNYPAQNGFIGMQGQLFGGNTKSLPYNELGNTIVDAGVQIKRANNIEFTNNEFTGIAKVGVGLYYGASNNKIEGNTFYSLGDSAVTVGLPSDNYISVAEDKQYTGYNLALNKMCTSTNSADGKYPAYMAADGKTSMGWSMESVENDNTKAWWQIDLGGEYEIDRIEIDDRGDADQKGSRRYFKISASNDSEFRTNVVTLAEVKTEEFAFKETWKKEITDKAKYRYVRIQKTINEYMYLAEIRIINYSMTGVPYKSVCADNKIYNNCITAIGEFNQGASGIQTYYTDNVDIAHNYIYNIPAGGIALGWGWEDYPNSVTSRNNKIRNNIIDNFGLLMIDNGAVYTLGQQPGSVITGNYISNQNNVYGAIYPDQGSAEYIVSGNVMENVWVSMFVSEKSKKNLTFTDNWATTGQSQMYGVNTTETNTRYFISGNMPEAAKSIANNAGLESEFKKNVLKVKISNSAFSDEQIFANVLGEVGGHMTDSKFLEYYLKDIIKGAEKIYDISLNDSVYGDSSRQKLKNAIEIANGKLDGFKNEIEAYISNNSNNQEAKYMAIIDRKQVLDVKKTLDKAVKEFTNSKNAN